MEGDNLNLGGKKGKALSPSLERSKRYRELGRRTEC